LATGLKPNYPLFTWLGAAAVLEVTPTSFGIQVAVHNAERGWSSARKRSCCRRGRSANWRLALHDVADEIELWVTGIAGHADLYELRRVYQVDSDGATPRRCRCRDGHVAGLESQGEHIAYMTMGPAGQQIVTGAGATRVLPTRNGLNMTLTFAPDGNTIVCSAPSRAPTCTPPTPSGTSPRAASRLVAERQYAAQFSPDGRVMFTSGRVGYPEVYISDADGTNAELLTPYNFETSRTARIGGHRTVTDRLEALIGGRMQIKHRAARSSSSGTSEG
jgi:hypothetical protein